MSWLQEYFRYTLFVFVVPLVLSRIAITTRFNSRIKLHDVRHDGLNQGADLNQGTGLNQAHVPYWRVNNLTLKADYSKSAVIPKYSIYPFIGQGLI